MVTIHEIYFITVVKVMHASLCKCILNNVYVLQAKGCDMVVLWLDCDKEGENICFEVLDAVRPVMNRPAAGHQVL